MWCGLRQLSHRAIATQELTLEISPAQRVSATRGSILAADCECVRFYWELLNGLHNKPDLKPYLLSNSQAGQMCLNSVLENAQTHSLVETFPKSVSKNSSVVPGLLC